MDLIKGFYQHGIFFSILRKDRRIQLKTVDYK